MNTADHFIAPSLAMDISPTEGRRHVFTTQEYKEIPIPFELLVEAGRLNVYDGLLKAGIIRTHSKEGKIVFQAGGWIGYVPINDQIFLEIQPRVAIRNLERLLCISGNSNPHVVSESIRQYSTSKELPNSLIDVLASQLCDLIDRCWQEGLHFDYALLARISSSPSGRIRPFDSARARAKSGDPFQVSSEGFYRTQSTPANQCIAAALDKLHTLYLGTENKSGVNVMRHRIARCRDYFSRVYRDPSLSFLHSSMVAWPESLPNTRPSYPATVALSKIVLSGGGIDFRSTEGTVNLPAMLINMEAAFEGYIRNSLRDRCQSIAIFDGNIGQPTGARKRLFHSAPVESPSRNTQSTPDIVCTSAEENPKVVVIDVKYKPDDVPSRDDLNQVLGYSLTYSSEDVVLLYPRRSASSQKGFRLIGTVSGVSVYTYHIDLNSDDIENEEVILAEVVQGLLAK